MHAIYLLGRTGKLTDLSKLQASPQRIVFPWQNSVEAKFSICTRTTDVTVLSTHLNPFTAPACQTSWAEKCTHAHIQTIYFPVIHIYIPNLFSILRVLIEILSHAKVRRKKARRLQILLFYWPFSSAIMAVKGLK